MASPGELMSVDVIVGIFTLLSTAGGGGYFLFKRGKAHGEVMNKLDTILEKLDDHEQRVRHIEGVQTGRHVLPIIEKERH